MKKAYTIKEAQRHLPAMVRTAERGTLASITRHNKTVAYVLGADEFGALIETMEILANPKAMKAIREAEAGRTKYIPVGELAD
ncbi:MAG TPA: type II toxin-antitoxin system prevent-host-death family antitoxin [Opitutus sp.]|nr:type II toxin-antitoxin system prevent-host-death family antitoxin [Opitutus sp.]